MSAQGMPPNLMALFAPRVPLVYMSPPRGRSNRRVKPIYTCMSDFVDAFTTEVPPVVEPTETLKERRERKKREKLEEHRKRQNELIAEYNPNTNDCATKNPYATLFVARLSYETTEKKLKKEFESYGPIKRVKVITDFNGKSRGYAFIEYEHETDLKKAYKQADGKKIDGRRVLVDVERSRTVPNWVPRRLGGGKGPARFTESKKKLAARSSVPASTSGASTLSKPSGARSGGSWEQQQHSGYHHHRSAAGGAGEGYGGPGSRGDGNPNHHAPPPRRSDDGRGGSGYYPSRKDDSSDGYYPGRRDGGAAYYNGAHTNFLAASSRTGGHYGPSETANSGGAPWSHADSTRSYGHSEQSPNGYDRDSRRRSRSRNYGVKRYRSRSRDAKRV